MYKKADFMSVSQFVLRQDVMVMSCYIGGFV